MCAAEQSIAVQLVHTIALDLVRGKQCRRRERQEKGGEKRGQKLDLLQTEATRLKQFCLSLIKPNQPQMSPERNILTLSGKTTPCEFILSQGG